MVPFPFPFFIFLILTPLGLLLPTFVSAAFRKNYVLERNESWNGHIYTVREEQPFFRVFHVPHTKVFRENPMAGKMDANMNTNMNPMQAQLMEEKGSDQRLRMAAGLWKHHNEQQQEQGGGRSKRAEQDVDYQQLSAKDTDGLPPAGGGGGKRGGPPGWQQQREGGGQQKQSGGMAQGEEGEEGPLGQQLLERNQNRSSAKFGYHKLPEGERKDTTSWPEQLWPFMGCLTLECTCPLFRGKLSGNRCILPNGKALKRAIRKDFRTYSRDELALFVEVMKRYKSSGLFTRLGMIHRRSGVHSGPSFFPWHREFLKRLEIVFRALHPENTEPLLGLPYWDSTLDNNLPAPEDSVMFSDYLLGQADQSGFVTTGLFANWTTMDGRPSFQRMFGDQPDGEFFNEARIDFVLSQTQVDRVLAFSLPLHSCTNYLMDDRFLEYSHDYVHYFISGDMQERFSSSNDPIFFMHHGFVDSVWERWRQTKQTRLQRERDYPRDDGECMPEWHFSYAYMPMLQPMRNLDALSNNYTDHMYEYAPRPTCEGGQSAECGNTDFLWCDTESQPGHPVCSTKVKPGGNCQGFEWSAEICYKGECQGGRCSNALLDHGRGGAEGEGGQRQLTKLDTSAGAGEGGIQWQQRDTFMRR